METLIIWAAIAGLYIGGYYEGEFGYYVNQLPWGRHRFEWKISGSPMDNTNAYGSLVTETTQQEGQLFYFQGHLTLKKRYTEVTIFSREDRFYVPSPLLKLINNDRLKDDSWGPKASGLRFDMWEKYGIYATAIISKYGTWDGEAYVFKGYKKFGTKGGAGFIYLRKDWRGGVTSYNDVKGFEGSIKVKGPLRATVEIAQSFHPEHQGNRIDRTAAALELRSFRFKNFLLATSVFSYGKDFVDELSNKFNPLFDREFGRRGIYSELIYLVPHKAINLIYKNRTYTTTYWLGMPDTTHYVSQNYIETYWEFINGFTFKASYEYTMEKRDRWKHLFFEIGGESRRAGGKVQLKIKDIGVNTKEVTVPYSIGQRLIFGVEIRYNITDNLQFYGRGAIGHGICGSWNSLFLQIAYRGFKNSEIYIEFGEPSHTADGLVNDPDVSDTRERRIERKAKIFYKFWF